MCEHSRMPPFLTALLPRMPPPPTRLATTTTIHGAFQVSPEGNRRVVVSASSAFWLTRGHVSELPLMRGMPPACRYCSKSGPASRSPGKKLFSREPTGRSLMPQGVMYLKCSRFGRTFKDSPCIVIHRLTRTPTAWGGGHACVCVGRVKGGRGETVETKDPGCTIRARAVAAWGGGRDLRR